MTNRIKVVLVTAYFPPEAKGGAEISTYLLAKGLQEAGHEVVVMTEGADGSREVDGLKVIMVRAGLREKPLWERRKSRQIAKVLNRHRAELERADILHANDFRSVLALMEWRKMNRGSGPIIATLRDYASCSGSTNFITGNGELPKDSIQDAKLSHRITEAQGLRRWGRWWQYRGNIKYRQRMFDDLDGEVFISMAQSTIIRQQRGASTKPTQIIFNPIADDYITKTVNDGYAGNVLYVGTVEYYKGVGLLIDSWRQVIQKEPKASLRIVGEGRNRQEYESRIEKYGLQYSVKLIGPVPWDQTIREYNQAQIVVAPHIWHEPFGRTVAEGMARGKVVVAADVGGPSEMIKTGKTGLLFKRNSREALSESIIKALRMNDTERQAMGREARAWVISNLTKERIASQYEVFYKQVISKQ